MKPAYRAPVLLLITYFFCPNVDLLPKPQAGSRSNWVSIVQVASRAIAVIETDKALGSGFFVNANGTLVTNHHVIADATRITVRLSTGEAYRRAYLLAADEHRDLAILRIEAADIPVLDLGNSNDVKAGRIINILAFVKGRAGCRTEMTLPKQ